MSGHALPRDSRGIRSRWGVSLAKKEEIYDRTTTTTTPGNETTNLEQATTDLTSPPQAGTGKYNAKILPKRSKFRGTQHQVQTGSPTSRSGNQGTWQQTYYTKQPQLSNQTRPYHYYKTYTETTHAQETTNSIWVCSYA